MAHNLKNSYQKRITQGNMSNSWSTVEEYMGKMVHRRVLPPEEVRVMLNAILMLPESKYTQNLANCVYRMVWGEKNFKVYQHLGRQSGGPICRTCSRHCEWRG